MKLHRSLASRGVGVGGTPPINREIIDSRQQEAAHMLLTPTPVDINNSCGIISELSF